MNRSYDFGLTDLFGETISLVLYIWQRLSTTSSLNQAAEPVPAGIVSFSGSSACSTSCGILVPSGMYLEADEISKRS
jgi:hypothetical protein